MQQLHSFITGRFYAPSQDQKIEWYVVSERDGLFTINFNDEVRNISGQVVTAQPTDAGMLRAYDQCGYTGISLKEFTTGSDAIALADLDAMGLGVKG